MKKMLNYALIVIVLLVVGCSGSTEPDNGGTGSSVPTNLVVGYTWNVDGNVCTVDLTWDAPENPSENNYEYNLYKDNQFLTNQSKLLTSYTDIDCIPGGEYTYFVTANYSTSGESDPSNYVNILIDMNEILLGFWHRDWSWYMKFEENGVYIYDSVPSNPAYGTYIVSHDTVSTTIWGNTYHDTVNFPTFNLMNYGMNEWERY